MVVRLLFNIRGSLPFRTGSIHNSCQYLLLYELLVVVAHTLLPSRLADGGARSLSGGHRAWA